MKIFISSTYEDLKEHRRAVGDAIARLGHQPIGMEYFGARPIDPQTAALDEIKQCDAMVGIYAHRFGWVPPGDTRSITEQEFDFARSHNIPCFCYRIKKDFSWDDSLKEPDAQAAGLVRFLGKIDSTFLRAEFTTPEDLAAKVAADLGRELPKQSPAGTRDPKRRTILEHVENFWIKGILEKSLYDEALLELGIKDSPDALNYPWTIKREPSKEILTAGTKMLEVFQKIGMGRSLLILGMPGSGKTTMLLELACELIECASQDVTEPIPVVFNLSSWTEKLYLADWLVAELGALYHVPKKVAQTWLKDDKMFLLLDGLDEVKQASRDQCLEAINRFRKEDGLTSIVVCSRSQEYAQLKERLAFDGAIEIQPLTPQQVADYFNLAGNSLSGVRQALEKDTALREMAKSPLFLSIMTLAYRDTSSDEIPVSANVDAKRKHLFDTYIKRMFERLARSHSELFNQQDVLRWLSWLARKMIEHNQVPFLLERMQPNWLEDKSQKWQYKLLAIIGGGLVGGLGGGLVGGPSVGLSGVLVGILLGVLVGGLVGGLGADNIQTVDSLRWNWRKAIARLLQNLFGMMVGVPVGALLGMLVGILLGVLVGGLVGGPSVGLSGVLVGILLGVLVGGLVGGLRVGLSVRLDALPREQTTFPGQRLTFSIKNSLIAFLYFELVFELGGGLLGGLGGAPGVGLVFGLGVGLVGGLYYGGSAVINHYLLRFILSRNKFLPWKLVPFLNYATDLIFLRRVGGSYIFVHRMLMEHFASLKLKS